MKYLQERNREKIGIFDPFWGEKSINLNQLRTVTVVRIIRQGIKNSCYNCSLYVKKATGIVEQVEEWKVF